MPSERMQVEVVGNPVVPGHALRSTAEPVRIGQAVQDADHGEPQICVERDGDVIKVIEVVCTCGKRVRLHCSYS
jgi:hypothetical protein